jgi:GT2 family glycosyltransferase
MVVEPLRDMSSGAEGYRVTGPNPELRLRSDRPELPSGWVVVSYRCCGSEVPSQFTLLADTQEPGLQRFSLPASQTGAEVIVRLPYRVLGMRLQPPAGAGRFEVDTLQITELGATQLLREVLRPYGNVLRQEPEMAWHFFRRGLQVLRRHGFRELQATLAGRFMYGPELRYTQWVRRYDTLTAHDRSMARRRLAQFRLRPTFTIIAPVDHGQPPELAYLLTSLRDQWYPDWELLLVEVRSLSDASRAAIRRQSSEDRRIRFVEASRPLRWFQAVGQALTQATGTFCGLVDYAAELSSHALYTMASECNEHPDAKMIYSDEDHIDGTGLRHSPLFKPDWNPDLLCSQPFVGHLTVYRTSLLRNLGGWRAELDGLEEWDLALRASAAIPETHIRHVPYVLCHQHTDTARPAGDVRSRTATARRIVGEHLQRLGGVAELSETTDGLLRVRYSTGARPLVSIIVPTRNGKTLLQRCVTGLREKTDYTNFELLVVDNRSDDPATLEYLRELGAQPNVRVLRFDAPFNFSAVNNFAAAHARGSILALLNDDIEVIAPDWLSEMVGHALRREVGAVGAKLYYPDGRIQHAGIILGMGRVAGQAYRGLPEPDPGSSVRTFAVHDVSAVTAACMLLRAEVYHSVGGLDANLPVAHGDVDFCLRLRQRGYRVVWTPHAQLYHWESATRGLDRSVTKVKRLRREEALMLKRWGSALRCDPAYNPNLTLAAPDFAVAFPPRVKKPWTHPV